MLQMTCTIRNSLVAASCQTAIQQSENKHLTAPCTDLEAMNRMKPVVGALCVLDRGRAAAAAPVWENPSRFVCLESKASIGMGHAERLSWCASRETTRTNPSIRFIPWSQPRGAAGAWRRVLLHHPGPGCMREPRPCRQTRRRRAAPGAAASAAPRRRAATRAPRRDESASAATQAEGTAGLRLAPPGPSACSN